MTMVVTFDPTEEQKKMIESHFEVVYSREVRDAKIVLSWNAKREIENPGDLENTRFLQLISAGVDHVPISSIPENVIIASNAGAYADPMAEHALAMALAMAKKLSIRHDELAMGIFDQTTANDRIKNSKSAILGFGGIGRAIGGLMRAMDSAIYAVNTSGKTDENVEFIGTLDDLDFVLKNADFLFITLPLTRQTRGLLGKRELEIMKGNAKIINVARGEIMIERDLYDHLSKNRDFMAAIDAWWIEPLIHGEFRMNYPFTDLPNVIGSPHNSALVPGSLEIAINEACMNIKRFMKNEPVKGIVKRDDYE